MPLTTYTAGDVLTAASLNANLVFAAASPASALVQVKSTAKTNTFTTTSTSFVDVTGLSVAITPTSATNKVLIVAQIAVGLNTPGTSFGHYKLSGGNTSAYVADAASSRTRAVFGGFTASDVGNILAGFVIVFLDSPATTSATTYVVQTTVGSSGTAAVNRSVTDTDDSRIARGASSITVFEVTP